MLCKNLEKLQTKRTLKFYLKLNFNNFQKKFEKVYIDCYNNLTIEIGIIGSCVNMISELVFSIILKNFLLHILLKGEYQSIFYSWFFS